MPRLLLRRFGPLGLALTAYDVWRRLPPKQRRAIVRAARTHGPRLGSRAVQATRARRARPPR